MAAALAGGTARLPLARTSRPRRALGRGTKECISSGIFMGLAALADGLAARMSREMGGGRVATVATGGAARLVAPFSRTFRRVEPGLVLEGVRLVAERSMRRAG
jgi:type III pantothenate kinase